MGKEMNENEGMAAKAAREFWRTRRFWSMFLPLVLSCICIGFLLGSWYAANSYREQSESRKLILAQCLDNNDKLTSQLAALGNKTATALDKLTTERK